MKSKVKFRLSCICGGLEVVRTMDDSQICTEIYCTQEEQGTIPAMRRTLKGILVNFLDQLDDPTFSKLLFSDAEEHYWNTHKKPILIRVEEEEK